MYKLTVFIPEGALETVKSSLFAAGAGQLGHYERCSFTTEGVGEFCPKHGASPHIGTLGRLEKVKEFRVEMVVEKKDAKEVIKALRASHPYEEPAFDLVLLANKEFE